MPKIKIVNISKRKRFGKSILYVLKIIPKLDYNFNSKDYTL